MRLDDVLHDIGVGVESRDKGKGGKSDDHKEKQPRPQPEKRQDQENRPEAADKIALQAEKREDKAVFQDILDRKLDRNGHQVGVKAHKHQKHFHDDADNQRNRHRDRKMLIGDIPDQGDAYNAGCQKVKQPNDKALLKIGFERVEKVGNHKDRFFVREVAQDVNQSAGRRADRHDRDAAD